MSASEAIKVRGLTKRYGRTAALRGVDLDLMQGEQIAVFGPNGSGKTTLLKVLAGLLRPTKGSLQIDGMDYKQDGSKIRRRIGVVSHHPYLYDDLTGEENLLFYGRMYGIEDLAQSVERALDRSGIKRRSRDKVRTLSRGMQQRLALARATLHDPDLLLLDEPDTGLDQEASAHISEFLEHDHGKRRSLVMATHNLRLGGAHCNRFVILSNGKVAYEGRTDGLKTEQIEELYRNHASAN